MIMTGVIGKFKEIIQNNLPTIDYHSIFNVLNCIPKVFSNILYHFTHTKHFQYVLNVSWVSMFSLSSHRVALMRRIDH